MKPFRTILASAALAFAALLTPLGVSAQALTDYAENKIVDAVFRRRTFRASFRRACRGIRFG
ncbi:MAG: hypothetical protein AB7N70_13955 [Dehalococcoidia bacterium]